MLAQAPHELLQPVLVCHTDSGCATRLLLLGLLRQAAVGFLELCQDLDIVAGQMVQHSSPVQQQLGEHVSLRHHNDWRQPAGGRRTGISSRTGAWKAICSSSRLPASCCCADSTVKAGYSASYRASSLSTLVH